jgi:hypothetical protein
MTGNRPACEDPSVDRSWWWADRSTAAGAADADFATYICRNSCPVREACLAEAMTTEGNATDKHRFGIYGGLTAIERARLYKGGRVQTTRPKPEPEAQQQLVVLDLEAAA